MNAQVRSCKSPGRGFGTEPGLADAKPRPPWDGEGTDPVKVALCVKRREAHSPQSKKPAIIEPTLVVNSFTAIASRMMPKNFRMM